MKDLSVIPQSNGGTHGMWNNVDNTRQVIVVHDTESGGAKGSINWMRSSQSGSYHVIVDLNGDAYRLVPDNKQSWSAMRAGNKIGLHICATGYASWKLRARRSLRASASPMHDGVCTDSSSSVGFNARKAAVKRWNDHPKMLEQLAQQIARWSIQYKIPLVWLTAAEVRAGKRGVCGHNEISYAFSESNHTDPGPSFPKQQLLARAQQIVKTAVGEDTFLDMTSAQLSEASSNFRQLGPT